MAELMHMYKHTGWVSGQGGQFVNVKRYLWMKDRERVG